MRTLSRVSQTDRALDDVGIGDVLAEYEDSDEESGDESDGRLLDTIDAYVDGNDEVSEADDDSVDESDGDQPESSEDPDANQDDQQDDLSDTDRDTDDEDYELPEIVMATETESDVETAAEVESPDALRADEDDPDVSDDVLDELRRADIDGPIVEMAPQDDTTSSRRRPRRSPEYDPAPVPIPADVPRILGRKPRVRRVTRVVRHVDPWSVFKIAVVAFLVLYVIVMTAGVLLWNVAYATGTIDNIERFFESFGWSSFEFNGGEIYHSAWIGGLFLVIGFTGLAVLAATLFNLITDLVGGMRFTVLEEEVVETRTSPMRRFVVRRAEPEVPAVTHDASGPIIREAVVDDSGSIPR
jgi:hypothetical protein